MADAVPSAAGPLRAARFAGDRRLAACAAGDTTLGTGSPRAAVARVQQALIDLGYCLRDFGPDGVFGRETADAVADFQADAGVSGEIRTVGSATMTALDSAFAGEPPARAQAPPAREAASSRRAAAAHVVRDAAVRSEWVTSAVRLALGQAAAGAHFLAGAAGDLPGSEAGRDPPPGDVTLVAGRTDPVWPAVFAAQCAVHGLHVCAGRFNARNGGIAGGRGAASTDTDLLVYLAGLAELPDDEWTPFFRFFSPRRCDGAGMGQRLVWGEDCRAKRHFDGAGLVNWCLAEASDAGAPIAFDIAAWAGGAGGTEAVALDEPPRTGDLLLRASDDRMVHIGFLVEAGDAGVDDGHARVVLAEQAGVGVVVRRFSAAGWCARRRLAAGPAGT